MSRASASARRRPEACCHSSKDSIVLTNAPTANTSQGVALGMVASTCGVLLTRSVICRPGRASVLVM